jgi:hypothetical protein
MFDINRTQLQTTDGLDLTACGHCPSSMQDELALVAVHYYHYYQHLLDRDKQQHQALPVVVVLELM